MKSYINEKKSTKKNKPSEMVEKDKLAMLVFVKINATYEEAGVSLFISLCI